MNIGKIMADLLKFTKKIAERIHYYDAIIDFSQETHWYNPFYTPKEIMIIWTDNFDKFNKY